MVGQGTGQQAVYIIQLDMEPARRFTVIALQRYRPYKIIHLSTVMKSGDVLQLNKKYN